MGNFIDLTDKRFGKLVVQKQAYKKGRHFYWDCLCDCGNFITVEGACLRHGNTISCKCTRTEIGKHHRRWKGHEEISSSFWTEIKNAAKLRDIEFSISMEEAWLLFLEQNRKCTLTGRGLFFGASHGERGNASLDRINSDRGYTKDNLQWVHKDLNRMKWIFTNDDFILICKEVAEYAKQQ